MNANHGIHHVAAAGLRKVDGWIAWIEGLLLVLLLGVLIFAAFWQVVQRNLGIAAASWVDTFNRHLVLWIGLLGATLATRENKHVNIEAIRKFLPRSAERWIDALVSLFAAAVAGLFTWASWTYFKGEMDVNLTLFTIEAFHWDVPAWALETILPAGFALIAIRFLAHALATLLGVHVKHEEPVPVP